MRELDGGRCGLDRVIPNINDSRNFGPEKFRSTSGTAVCEIMTCPLRIGVPIQFPLIAGETVKELENNVTKYASEPDEVIFDKLVDIRLNQCPVYKSGLKAS